MSKVFLSRGAIAVVAAIFLALGIGFIAGMDWAVELWPGRSESWPGADPAPVRLAHLFVGSFAAAIGASAAFVAWSGDFRTATGGFVGVTALFVALAIALLVLRDDIPGGVGVHVAVFLAVAALAASLIMPARRLPYRDLRPIPVWVRLAIGVVVFLLIVAGVLLVMRRQVFPWPVPGVASVLYGAMFLGIAWNYAYVVLFGRIGDAMVSLCGFLLYDLVLLGPFAARFADVPIPYRTSLTVYTAVLVFTALVSLTLFATALRTRVRTA